MTDLDARFDAVWNDDTLSETARIVQIDAIADECEDAARAAFERAGARDSAGLEVEAEALYRQALAQGLPEHLRVRAVVQLASTLRNLGHVAESLELLRAEHGSGGELADAVSAFYALSLASAGDPLSATSVALQALAPHLPRYRRSVTGYAQELRPPR